MQLQFLWFSFIGCHHFFLQHCHYQHPPHEDARQLCLRLHWHWLICILQFIIHLNNKEYLIEILCDSIVLSILQIWQKQFNQVLVQILDSAVHLHDLNDLINTSPPSIKDQNFRHPPPPSLPLFASVKICKTNYLRNFKWCGTPLIIKTQ